MSETCISRVWGWSWCPPWEFWAGTKSSWSWGQSEGPRADFGRFCSVCSAPVRANETLFKWLSLSRSCQCLQFRISSPEKPPRASPPFCASLSVPAAARACPASLHPHSLHQNSGYSPGRSHQFLFSQLCLPGEASQGRKPWLCFTQAAFSDL